MTGQWNSGDLEIFGRYPALTAKLYWAHVCKLQSEKLAEKKLKTLRDAGLIASHPLTGNKVYYTTTAEGAKALGIRKRPKPLGPHAIMRHIATAAYAAMTGIVFKAQEDVEELSEKLFGEVVWPNGIPSTLCYTVPEGNAHAFCCVIVDYGKAIRRLHKSLERHFRRLENYPVARALLKSNHYRLVVLTGFEPKAQKIRRLKLPHVVEVVVIPELGDLLRGQH